MKIGYARISTAAQDLALQLDALHAAGCEQIYREQASGKRDDRPELAHALQALRAGDTLVVWRLDRLGRSLPHLVATIDDLIKRNVLLVSVTENIDTSTASGMLMIHVFAVLADFERNLIRERTAAGLAAARARGRVGGRKPVSKTKIASIKAIANNKSINVIEACRDLGISRATFYKYAAGDE